MPGKLDENLRWGDHLNPFVLKRTGVNADDTSVSILSLPSAEKIDFTKNISAHEFNKLAVVVKKTNTVNANPVTIKLYGTINDGSSLQGETVLLDEQVGVNENEIVYFFRFYSSIVTVALEDTGGNTYDIHTSNFYIPIIGSKQES
jgi:hypothetical protein